MSFEPAYIQVVVALHAAFAGVFFFLHREQPTRFARLFAWCWTIEAVRAAILLPSVHGLGGWIEEWFATADALAIVANACLLAGFADLFAIRLPRRLVAMYVGLSILLVLIGRYAWPALAASQFGQEPERARFHGVLFNLIVMFIPVAIVRIVICVWLFKDWHRTRLPGALIAGIFSLPYAAFALLAPLQFAYAYRPDWVAYFWVVRVLGFSIGLVMLMFSRQEVAIAKSEAALVDAQSLAQIGSWEFDSATRRITWSAQMYRLFDQEPARGPLDLEALRAAVVPEDRSGLDQAVSACRDFHAPGVAQFRFIPRDGRMRWIEWRFAPELGEGGVWLGCAGTAQDISDRVRAHERIRQLNRVYAVLSEINQTIVRVPDTDELFRAACRIAVEHGEFPMAWIGAWDGANHRLKIAAHAGASPAALAILERIVHAVPDGSGCVFTHRALSTGAHAVCNDIEHDTAAASWRAEALAFGYRAMASFPLTVRDRAVGTFNLYAGQKDFFDGDELRLLDELAFDISFAIAVHERELDRERAELALHASEERFRQLAENIGAVFWMVDPANGAVLYVSPAFATVWGRRPDEVVTMSAWIETVHPDDRARVSTSLLHRAAPSELEYRIAQPDGGVRWIEDRAFPVRDRHGHIYRVVGVARDVTDQRRLEEQLRQAQKLEAIGQLSAGVAHDFNNILTVLQLQSAIGRAEAGLSPAAAEAFEEINRGVERAANLTRQLLAFSRRQALQTRNLDLNELVMEIVRMLQRIVGEDVRIDLSLAPGPAIVNADRGMIEQVLMNLVVNSRDAMPRGGALQITTFLVRLTADQAAAAHGSEGRAGDFVGLTVADTGMGISPENLPRIFEPFFTTKDVGRGTGLGLSTVYGIVQQHNGWVSVESKPGAGATFRVYLPRVVHSAAANAPAAPSGKLTKPAVGATILVVEDEPALRSLVRRVLSLHGHRVLEAESGPAALEVWREHRDAIQLVITDLVMPDGMSGLELADRLQRDRPDLRVIYTSGYSAEIAAGNHRLETGVNFIPKPFDVEQITTTVNAALRAR